MRERAARGGVMEGATEGVTEEGVEGCEEVARRV